MVPLSTVPHKGAACAKVNDVKSDLEQKVNLSIPFDRFPIQSWY